MIKKILISLILITTVSCATKHPPITTPDTPEKLYSSAIEEFKAKNYKQAAEAFSKITYQFPYYDQAKRALIMEAYAYYLNHDYDDAIIATDNFFKLYPTATELDYMHYLKGISYYAQIDIPNRDQTTTMQAKEVFSQLIQRFPDTRYARDAQMKLDLVNNNLAAHEMIVGRYYIKRGELIAAIKRYDTVVKEYSTTTHIAEALYRLAEIYTILGNVKEAQKLIAVLGYNYPKSSWYKLAYDLARDQKN